MLFSSVPFLFYFLPAALLLYFLVPRRLKNAALLLASLFFYAWGEPKYVVLMLVSIAQGYLFGLLVEKYRGRNASRLFLSLSILVSLGLLGYFKYADFFLASVNAATGLSLPLLKLSLPIGISFYTFQVLSYVIDVYRGDTAAQRNFIDLAAYVSLFPQLIAGPIVRYSDVALQLRERTHSVSAAAEGVRRFTIGFCKKILLANQFGALASAYQQTQQESVLFVWLYALAFLLQVYFDFSGYSDMAIGLGRMFGFHFLENFNYPYVSRSVTEFWRRWHISLSTWFRDYVYIPLGGSRNGNARTVLSLTVVWFFTGLWHGASWNFVLWGVMLLGFILLEKFCIGDFLKEHKVLSHVYLLFVIPQTWVIFRITRLKDVGAYFSRLFPFFGTHSAVSAQDALKLLSSYWWLLLLGILFCLPQPRRFFEKHRGTPLIDLPLFVLFWVCVYFIATSSGNAFLYSRF
mgnify:CR=1 FL=1